MPDTNPVNDTASKIAWAIVHNVEPTFVATNMIVNGKFLLMHEGVPYRVTLEQLNGTEHADAIAYLSEHYSDMLAFSAGDANER